MTNPIPDDIDIHQAAISQAVSEILAIAQQYHRRMAESIFKAVLDIALQSKDRRPQRIDLSRVMVSHSNVDLFAEVILILNAENVRLKDELARLKHEAETPVPSPRTP